jgi:hypothetical protein
LLTLKVLARASKDVAQTVVLTLFIKLSNVVSLGNMSRGDSGTLFMSPCGIGLTPLPLGKHFSIILQWNTEKDHIVRTILKYHIISVRSIDIE